MYNRNFRGGLLADLLRDALDLFGPGLGIPRSPGRGGNPRGVGLGMDDAGYAPPPPPVTITPMRRKKLPGVFSSLMMRVFGGVFSIPMVLVTIILLENYLQSGPVGFASCVTAALLTMGAVLLWRKGLKIGARNKRFYVYQKAIGAVRFCELDKLAAATGRSLAFIRKDLVWMMREGMFVNAYLDKEQTCLMLDEETYQQYLQLQSSRKQREEAEAAKQPPKAAEPAEQQASASPEVRAMVTEGRAYIRQIHQANDALPGEEISEKLDRLERVTLEIFGYIEKHPEKLPDIRRMMQYHLPTTLKLVATYQELEGRPLQGENIRAAKNEIQRTLDTINVAFENLLNSLYDDVALDVSSDISVLKTMLAQEGLTGDDFKKAADQK